MRPLPARLGDRHEETLLAWRYPDPGQAQLAEDIHQAQVGNFQPLALKPEQLTLLAQACSFTSQLPHIVEVLTPHLRMPQNLDLLNTWRMQEKRPLNTYAMGDTADRKIAVDPTAPDTNNGPLKYLHPLAVAFNHAQMDTHRITRSDFREIIT
jgi:hypothetical protein